MVELSRQGESLESREVWTEGELAFLYAAEGFNLSHGVAKLSASFMAEALTGYSGMTGAAQALQSAEDRIRREVEAQRLPFHWRRRETAEGPKNERAFYRFDIQRWMELSRHRIKFSGAMVEIFTPAMRPETQAIFAALQEKAAEIFGLGEGGGVKGPQVQAKGWVPQLDEPKGQPSGETLGIEPKERGTIALDPPAAGSAADVEAEGDPSQDPQGEEHREEKLLRLDQEVASLTPRDRDRLLCRAVARDLWRTDDTRSITSILKDPRIDGVTGRAWPGRDTVRNWIKDLDPRPPQTKPGPGRGSTRMDE